MLVAVLVPSSSLAALGPGALVGAGQAPSVAINSTGTAYVAWNGADQPPTKDQPVMLCVVGAGAPGCAAPRMILRDGFSASAQPALVDAPAPGVVRVVSARTNGPGDVELDSSNGGVTFSAPRTIASKFYFSGAFGPRGLVLVSGTFVDLHFQIGAPTAPALGDAATLPLPAAGGSIAGWSGATPVIVAGTVRDGTFASSWSGRGNLNDAATWMSGRVGGRSLRPALASGPRGLFLLQDQRINQTRLTVRRFVGGRFGPARLVAKTIPAVGTALAQDSAGRLLAVWYVPIKGQLRAAASRDGGRHWSRPRTIAAHVPVPGRMSAALGPSGRGWLAYELNVGSQIHLVKLNAPALLRRRR